MWIWAARSLKLFNRARATPTHSGIWKETLVRPSALTSTTRALKLLLWLLPLNTQWKICVISLHFKAQNHDKKSSFQWTKSRWYYSSETWAPNRYMVRVFSILKTCFVAYSVLAGKKSSVTFWGPTFWYVWKTPGMYRDAWTAISTNQGVEADYAHCT